MFVRRKSISAVPTPDKAHPDISDGMLQAVKKVSTNVLLPEASWARPAVSLGKMQG